MARTLALPPGGAVALFALGRTVGWIGHAMSNTGAAPSFVPGPGTSENNRAIVR